VLSRQGWKDATERKKTLDEKTARIREEEEQKEYVFVRANRAKQIHKRRDHDRAKKTETNDRR
jgi:hypothetical protein